MGAKKVPVKVRENGGSREKAVPSEFKPGGFGSDSYANLERCR
jgi:hypothetical protein